MIAFITICYAGIYVLVFNKLGLLKKTVGNISAFAGAGVVMIGTIVFMWYTFSPMSGDARMFRYIIPIVPNVRGEVVDVPVEAVAQISRGDILFQIDPEPFEIVVRQLEAQVKRHEAEKRLAQVNVGSPSVRWSAPRDLDQIAPSPVSMRSAPGRTRSPAPALS